MRTTTARIAALVALAGFALAGCGPAQDDAPAEAPAVSAPSDSGGDDAPSATSDQGGDAVDMTLGGTYDKDFTFSLTKEPLVALPETGGTITLTMDAQPDDHEEVAWLEQYRQDVGGDPVAYIVSDIDNRDGEERLDGSSVYVYDLEGTEYECEAPEWFVDENWEPVWLYVSTDKDEYESADGDPMEYAKAEELSDRASSHEWTSGASPLARGTSVAICPDGLPDRATGVQVMPGGIVLDPVLALPETVSGMDG